MQANFPDSVLENMRNIVFQDCVVSGSLSELLYRIENMETVEFYNFDTSNVTDMSWMFSCCSSLAYLDVSGFDTRNVTYMNGMFSGWNNLKSIDLSSFEISDNTNTEGMLGGDNLETIITPKSMAEGTIIYLPVEFYDEEMNYTMRFIWEDCNKTLTRAETKYSITYHLDDGENNANNPASCTKNSPTITLNAPTKIGYTFNGWYD